MKIFNFLFVLVVYRSYFRNVVHERSTIAFRFTSPYFRESWWGSLYNCYLVDSIYPDNTNEMTLNLEPSTIQTWHMNGRPPLVIQNVNSQRNKLWILQRTIFSLISTKSCFHRLKYQSVWQIRSKGPFLNSMLIFGGS